MEKTLQGAADEFRRHLKAFYMSKADHRTLDDMTLDELVFAACVLDDRSIHVHPRRVFLSQELTARQLNAETSDQLKKIIDDCEAGKSLNPLLNDLPKLRADRAEDQLNKVSDQLLVQHGIHHLHLRRKRSNDLLFACFAREAAFFIDVTRHDFSPQRYLDIVLRDCPRIAGYEEVRGNHIVSCAPRESDLKASLYQVPIGYIIESNGKFYTQVGRGGSSFGTSVNARRRAYEVLRYCEDIAAFNANDAEHAFTFSIQEILTKGRVYLVGIDDHGRLASFDPKSGTLYPSGFEFTI
ncbi:hypothetical protein GG681_16830 [Epibacterium sp. SM1969]|uniref:Uncharacterized protein n=1 Tax=Tritonibacter aquimaris TaxID=2663379 RepID=A0A844B1A3_9RHOB|nr:hypothetical protein [Tritonibacter aquimaris]MQY44314.1 hypothetical protein [Tritonibacter aquimaris]